MQYLQLPTLGQNELLGVLLSQQLRRLARLDMTQHIKWGHREDGGGGFFIPLPFSNIDHATKLRSVKPTTR